MDYGTVVKSIKEFFLGRSVDIHLSEVRARNAGYLRSFSILGVCMMMFTVVFGQLLRSLVSFNGEFAALLFYFALMFAYTCFTKGRTEHATIAIYAWMSPLMALAVLIGTFLDPTEPSITIMVFICVLPLFILDKPWRITVFITVSAAVYAVCCYYAKTRELFAIDLVDLVLFYIFGVGVNCLLLRDRLNSVEYAVTMRIASETDALTGLYNRGAGERSIRTLLGQGRPGMFCIADIDGFKDINDIYGHQSGDAVLRGVAARLRTSFRSGDIVTRIGGDEFAVYAVGVTDIATGAVCIERLFRQISGMNLEALGGSRVSISLGVTFFDAGDGKNFETVYREGDEALYQAKRGGKAQYYFFETPAPAGAEEEKPEREAKQPE